MFWVSSWESLALFSADNRFEISVPILLLLQNLPLLQGSGKARFEGSISAWEVLRSFQFDLIWCPARNIVFYSQYPSVQKEPVSNTHNMLHLQLFHRWPIQLSCRSIGIYHDWKWKLKRKCHGFTVIIAFLCSFQDVFIVNKAQTNCASTVDIEPAIFSN